MIVALHSSRSRRATVASLILVGVVVVLAAWIINTQLRQSSTLPANQTLTETRIDDGDRTSPGGDSGGTVEQPERNEEGGDGENLDLPPEASPP